MSLPLSGTLSMSEISVELSYPATQILSLGQEDARQLADVPAGVISISDFYGKSSVVGQGILWGNNTYKNVSLINTFSTETLVVGPDNSGGLYGTAFFADTSNAYTSTGWLVDATIKPYSTRVDRYSFSTSTFTRGVGAVPIPRALALGFSGTTYGYVIGGSANEPPTGTTENSVQTFNFSTSTGGNTTSSPTGVKFNQGIGQMTNGDYLVTIRGAGSLDLSYLNRMNTATSAWDGAVPLPTPAYVNSSSTGAVNSAIKGYTLGGRMTPSPSAAAATTSLEVDYATYSQNRIGMTTSLRNMAALSGSDAGYGFGGQAGFGPAPVNSLGQKAVKFQFYTGSVSSLSDIPVRWNGWLAYAMGSQPTSISF
jgi:hypothetical protein